MQALCFLLAASGLAKPAAKSYAADYGYFFNPNAAQVVDTANSQFQAQDELGQYNYGYSNPLSAKQETKTADGVTRGSYSYIDAHGITQTVNYISDVMGFRAEGTNVPKGANAGPVIQAKVHYGYLPYAAAHPYYFYEN